jgi:hypothetical protein
MHIEFLVEDSSGERMLSQLLPKILGEQGAPHTWRMKAYKGIGRIPPSLSVKADPAKRMLLDQLPRLLQAYGKTMGIDAVVVVLDTDSRECKAFLAELQSLVTKCRPAPRTLFRLAIEEMEAWYLGDRQSILKAYPRAKRDVIERYVQDSVCGTWELLADAIYPGGIAAIKKSGWPLPGQIKHEWAEKITPFMDVSQNTSPSFMKLRDGLLKLAL